jgi:glucose/galactose transporter
MPDMDSKKKSYVIPLIFVGMMFFVVGFAMGINSYLVPLVQSTLNVSSGESYLIIAATFCAFLFCSYPAAKILTRIGYKRTMSLAFLIFAIGFALMILSGKLGSLWLFLFASFVSGVGNTVLQAAINPYVTILGPIESAAKRISIMGICNALAWPVAPLFLAAVIGKDISSAVLSDVTLPFLIIIAVVIVLGVVMYFSPLEEVKAAGEDEESAADCPYAAGKTSLWQFPHLILGAVALFFYVGVETLALSSSVDYATYLKLANPESYAIWPSVGMALGYIVGIITIPKYLSQSGALRVFCWIAVAGSLSIVLTPPAVSVWCVAFLGFACSVMYPAIWPLAIVDLGRFTKVGSSLLVASLGGGALIPLLFGFLKDAVGNQDAYWICLPCYIFIMYYAYKGYKIRR